ncbi:hypothetical protein DFQ27_004304 [Actinomortierella ambigua]|uniref:Uncharacterized protein n=1 Tax=Actinomortierella ambigua TaxID=1343610 RepID=A0A9P6UCM0_9FUNG|nr:hypothetical protein DFQ27_004304 [Actinomortierella ambigua]
MANIPPVPRLSSATLQTIRPFGNIAQARLSQPLDEPSLSAVVVPIGRLEAVRALVVSRTIRVSDPKPFKDKRNPSQTLWTQSLTIKDEHDTIDIKIWHRSQEHVQMYWWLKLDLLIHVWTDDVKLSTTDSMDSSTVPSTTSPLVMAVNEGKHGHQIVLGSPEENGALFRTALGVNAGGIIDSFHLDQLLGAGDSLHQQQRPDLLVLVQKIGVESQVRTRFGEACKRTLDVLDGQGREARLTFWGALMSRSAEDWTANETVLVLTAPKVGVYNQKLDVSVGYQTHVQVNPLCKTVEWLRHAASQFNTVGQTDRSPAAMNVTLNQITTFYSICDIPETILTLSSLNTSYGYTIGVISQLDIEQRNIDLMSATCLMCRQRVTSHQIMPCETCKAEPPAETWKFTLSRLISFMDDTGELCHPIIDHNVAQAMLGFSASEFSGLNSTERMQVKARLFLERFKVFFKIVWSDFRRQHTVEVVAIEPPVLSDN